MQNEMKLKMLIQLLNDKESALEQILVICENQETLILSLNTEEPNCQENQENRDFYALMNTEKQSLIDVVIQRDEIFQTVFSEISPMLETIAQSHRELLLTIQEQIKRVTNLDAKIRVQEARNRSLVSGLNTKVATKVKPTASAKSHVLNEYAKNSKNWMKSE